MRVGGVLATDTVPDLPLARSCSFDPPDGAAELRERGPVARARRVDGSTAWLVTGHAEARLLLSGGAYDIAQGVYQQRLQTWSEWEATSRSARP
jgi:hypothetical protein